MHRGQLLELLRTWFRDHNAEECWTSPLGLSSGADTHLRPLEVGGQRLHSSPEFAMKRLLAGDLRRSVHRDLYQIATVFRADEEGPLHRSCFQLLEWYRRDWSVYQLMDEVEGLVRSAGESGGGSLSFGSMKASVHPPFPRLEIADLLREDGIEAAPTCEAMGPQLCRRASEMLGQSVDNPCEAFDLWMDHRMSGSGGLGSPTPCFVYGFPLERAALASLHAHAPLPAQRFELLACGVELANGWQELQGREANRARLEDDNRARLSMDLGAEPLDHAFLDDMEELPPCSGVALGVERLLMLCSEACTLGELTE